jgi:hypothetical protein
MLTNFTKIYERPEGALQGYINISLTRVADLLGRPNGYRRDENISKEWNISVDGVPLSLYYYYNDPLLHVAGASLEVVSKAEQLLQHPGYSADIELTCPERQLDCDPAFKALFNAIEDAVSTYLGSGPKSVGEITVRLKGGVDKSNLVIDFDGRIRPFGTAPWVRTATAPTSVCQ